MNKKFFLLGGAALMGGAFVALTAFGGMTKAQQQAQIDEAVAAKIADLRAAKDKECEESVAKAANAKAQEMLAAPAPAPVEPSKPGATKPAKKPTKGTGSTSPKVDPMPQPAPPAPKTEPQKERGGSTAPEVQKQRSGTAAPEVQKKRAGAATVKEGGN